MQHAATLIQTIYRKHRARYEVKLRKFKRQSQRNGNAARCIQRAARACIAHKRAVAATCIQSVCRKHDAQQWAKHLRDAKRTVHNKAATRIQSVRRMYLAINLVAKLKREQAAKRPAKRQADMPPAGMPPAKRHSRKATHNTNFPPLSDKYLSTFRFDPEHNRKVFAALGEPQYMCTSTVHTDFNSFVTVERFTVARAQLQNEGLDLQHIHTHTYKIINKH